MPYITKGQRFELIEASPRDPGELNYIISIVIKGYLDSHGHNYKTMNDIMGALEGAKLEFYRRIAAPYEDKKIKENGDVY